MAVHLTPLPPDPGAGADWIDWRVGPGLIRVDDEIDPATAPAPVDALFAAGVLRQVQVSPGRIRTRLAAGRTPARDGAAVRSALFAVLSAPGGWPDGPGPTTGPVDPGAAADAEIDDAVRAVLSGEFGSYTAGHGGRIELLGVRDGIVSVAMGGACHGCAAADRTLDGNLAQRLARLPGYRELVVDDGPTPLPDPTLPTRRFRRSPRSPASESLGP